VVAMAVGLQGAEAVAGPAAQPVVAKGEAAEV
jgi:hypothetical protein